MLIEEKELDALTRTSPPLLKRKRHAWLPISIFNYTNQAQFRKHWNPLTLAARGLIIEHDTSLVVARPMAKFFNYDQRMHTEPQENTRFSVLEKVDGSLGIYFCYRGDWMMASRGSFDGSQANEGAALAAALGLHQRCDEGKTYCFEIVYPENRIVVDYGKRRDLILLAVIDTATGYDASNVEVASIAAGLGVKAARTFDVSDLDIRKLYSMDKLNEEGFVVRFEETGERVKVKFASYLDLANGRSTRKGGQKQRMRDLVRTMLLKDPSNMVENNLDSIPDEFYDEAREAQKEFFEMFDRAGRDFDSYILQYGTKELKDIPTDSVGKPLICKWLRMSSSGQGTEEARNAVRREYALRILGSIWKRTS